MSHDRPRLVCSVELPPRVLMVLRDRNISIEFEALGL